MGHTRHENHGEMGLSISNGIGYSNNILTPEDIRKLEKYLSDKWAFNIDPPPLMIGQNHKVQDESI